MNETTSKTYTVRTVDYYGNVEFHTFNTPAEVTEFVGEADMGHHTLEIEGYEFEGDWPTSEEMFDWYESETAQQSDSSEPAVYRIEHEGSMITANDGPFTHSEVIAFAQSLVDDGYYSAIEEGSIMWGDKAVWAIFVDDDLFAIDPS